VIFSAFFLFAERFIPIAINSFPTIYSGKWIINFITYNFIYNTNDKQSVYANITLILSSIVNKYKMTIAINLKFEIFSKSIILGTYPAYSICSLQY